MVSWKILVVAEVVFFVGFWIPGRDDYTFDGLRMRWEGGINYGAWLAQAVRVILDLWIMGSGPAFSVEITQK